MVDANWIGSLLEPLNVAESISRNVRLDVYKYLPTKEIINSIARLSKSERARMQDSYIANRERTWHVNLDLFDPSMLKKWKGTDREGERLFDRLQYVLSVVFQVRLEVSTRHGLQSLFLFIEDMPEKFDKERVDLHFNKVDFGEVEVLASKLRALRPSLTLRSMSISVKTNQGPQPNNL